MDRNKSMSPGEGTSKGQDESNSEIKSLLNTLLLEFHSVKERLEKVEKRDSTPLRDESPVSGAESGAESARDRGNDARLQRRPRSRQRKGVADSDRSRRSRSRFSRRDRHNISPSPSQNRSSSSSDSDTARGGKREFARGKEKIFVRDDRYKDQEDYEEDDQDHPKQDHAGHEDRERHSVNDFCVQLGNQNNAPALNDLGKDLEVKVQDGDRIHDKLAEAIFNRFTVSLPKEKLDDKLKAHKIPENCKATKAPTLDKELVDKGYVDRAARKDDNRLADIQNLIATATAALGQLSHELNSQVAGGTADNKALDIINKVIKVNGDVYALLGHAQQELSQRRRYKVVQRMPREVASIATATIRPGAESLFDDDTDYLMKTARANYKAQQYRLNKRGRGYGNSQKYHPYQNQGYKGGYKNQKQHFLDRHPSMGRGAQSRGGNNPKRGGYRK